MTDVQSVRTRAEAHLVFSLVDRCLSYGSSMFDASVPQKRQVQVDLKGNSLEFRISLIPREISLPAGIMRVCACHLLATKATTTRPHAGEKPTYKCLAIYPYIVSILS